MMAEKITKEPSKKKMVKRKAPEKKAQEEKPEKNEAEAPEQVKYFEAVGRRKTSVARVRMFTQGEKQFLINAKPYKEYFPIFELQQIVSSALEKMKCLDRFRILVKVKGGGIHSQAEAVRHGTSLALVIFNPDFRKRLRKAGYITRDPRARERKKFGLKRARRAPQWAKR